MTSLSRLANAGLSPAALCNAGCSEDEDGARSSEDEVVQPREGGLSLSQRSDGDGAV